MKTHHLITAAAIAAAVVACAAAREPVADAGPPPVIQPVAEMESWRSIQLDHASAGEASPEWILFATPNGNSAEWTMGRRMREGMDWHYDIQHVAAQVRWLQEEGGMPHLAVNVIEPEGRSWPTWVRVRSDQPEKIQAVVTGEVTSPSAANQQQAPVTTLTGHSGGGALTFGYINTVEEIPHTIDRIAFLDSNYNFDAEKGHGAKLARWLRADPKHTLVVLAYDDRRIEVNGKRVVSDTGGTYRATLERMVPALEAEGIELMRTESGPWIVVEGMGDQIDLRVHTNPENRILHTVLVGDMNGLIHAMTVNTPQENPERYLREERLYTEYIPE